MQVFHQALCLLFPQARCLACGEPRRILPGEALCDACNHALNQLRLPEEACGHCRGPRQKSRPCPYCLDGGMRHLDGAHAPYLYQDQARQLILRLKFGPVSLAAKPLARAMAAEIQGVVCDALVPVPLHKTQLRQRGVNQSQLLCEHIASLTGHKVTNALQKTRHTRRQSGLTDHEAREENVREAYQSSVSVKGLRLILVDDVRTSGATARACAGALRQAGADSVVLLTAAVAWPGRKT